MHASCESPCHLSAKRCLLDTCFLLTAPFRTMLLTARGGPRCLGPKAYGVPVHLIAFLLWYVVVHGAGLASSWAGSAGMGWVSVCCCTGWCPPSIAGWRRSVAWWPRG